MKNLFALVFIISNLCADTSGTDNNAINKEISNFLGNSEKRTQKENARLRNKKTRNMSVFCRRTMYSWSMEHRHQRPRGNRRTD